MRENEKRKEKRSSIGVKLDHSLLLKLDERERDDKERPSWLLLVRGRPIGLRLPPHPPGLLRAASWRARGTRYQDSSLLYAWWDEVGPFWSELVARVRMRPG